MDNRFSISQKEIIVHGKFNFRLIFVTYNQFILRLVHNLFENIFDCSNPPSLCILTFAIVSFYQLSLWIGK